MWYPRLAEGTEEGGGKISEIQIEVCCSFSKQYYTNFNFLVLINVPWSCGVLTSGEMGGA